MKFYINRDLKEEPHTGVPFVNDPPDVDRLVDNTVRTVQRTIALNNMEIQVTRHIFNDDQTFGAVVADKSIDMMRSMVTYGYLNLDERQFDALCVLFAEARAQIDAWKGESDEISITSEGKEALVQQV